MSNSENSPQAEQPLASVTLLMYRGGKVDMRTTGHMSADLLLSLLFQTLWLVSGQVIQQHSSTVVLAAGGGVPRAD